MSVGLQAFSLGFGSGGGITNISGALNTTTQTGNYQILSSDNIVYVNATAPSSQTLPVVPAQNQFLIIKDIAGNAATDNITVIGTVDGVVNPTIGSNYGGVLLTYNGTTWSEHA
jgi:hypothetical protein